MYKLSKELDEAGYAIRTGRVKIPDRVLIFSYVGLLIVGCCCGYLFWNSYRMNWTVLENNYAVDTDNAENEPAQNSSIKTDIAALKKELAMQGFPEYVLDDLKDEEIEKCAGTLRIVTNIEDNEYGIQFTDVAVQVPDVDERWIIFHYYRWMVDKKFYGTESVQVWTTYRDNPRGWASYGDISGRVLYDKAGITYVSPYHSMETESYYSNSILYGEHKLTDVFGTFLFPRDGVNCRGYVVYSTVHINTGYVFTSFLNYTHQKNWMQYPVMTSYENRKTTWFDSEPFITIQNYWMMLNTMEAVVVE